MEQGLVSQLRQLAKHLHDDLSIGEDAANRIEELEATVMALQAQRAQPARDAMSVQWEWSGSPNDASGILTLWAPRERCVKLTLPSLADAISLTAALDEAQREAYRNGQQSVRDAVMRLPLA